MYINATIYMGVIAVYELLARYSGKPYPISRPFLWGIVPAILDAGHLSVTRRMATHLPEWTGTDKVGSIGAMLVVLGMLYFAIRITAGLLKAPVRGKLDDGPANTAG